MFIIPEARNEVRVRRACRDRILLDKCCIVRVQYAYLYVYILPEVRRVTIEVTKVRKYNVVGLRVQYSTSGSTSGSTKVRRYLAS